MIMGVLEDHYERLKSMEKSYIEKLAALPRGNVQFKNIKGKLYPYLVYREGMQVKSKYLKLGEAELEDLKFKLAQRQKYMEDLRELKRDCRILEKAINRK